MTQPVLSLIAAAIADGRRDTDIWNAPGELSLAALVAFAERDPRRSRRELLAEALEASSPSLAALDTFSLRRLAMRAKRYARAAAIVEEFCAARGTAPEILPPGTPERRSVPERRIRKHPPMGTKMGRPGWPPRDPVGRAVEHALIQHRARGGDRVCSVRPLGASRGSRSWCRGAPRDRRRAGNGPARATLSQGHGTRADRRTPVNLAPISAWFRP